ncbi:patatin-like phospholipase family protein [Roseateles sp.]|uniref:patatin-like phospholipase family protein n=1 Tax=Roseateles sp. TaxID=1971397 RepID=UPI0039E79E56
MHAALRLGVLCAALLLTACSSQHYLVNPPLSADSNGPRYSISDVPPQPNNSDSLHIVVTLSGGGYRAAALAYAVLDALNDTVIQWEGTPRSLLNEVDIISSVSGGSLAAADFLVHRDEYFPGFERRVLGLDLQSKAVSKFLSPSGLFAQTSSRYGRGDLLQEVLDAQLFHGATYGALPRQRPVVILNATDIHSGERFGFTQEEFDHLCSDLSLVPVARAVAASMAVPVVASPITLWNHSLSCPVRPRTQRSIPFIDEARYLHLADGGLADNTGARMPLEYVAAAGGLLQSTRLGGYRGIKRGVFIIVNAMRTPRDDEDDTPDTPGILRQFQSVHAVPIKRSSVDGIGLLGAAIERWAQQIREANPQVLDGLLDSDLRFHVIEIGLKELPGRAEFLPLRSLPTELRISQAEVQSIKQFVRAKLDGDPAWHALLDDLNSSARPPEPSVVAAK